MTFTLRDIRCAAHCGWTLWVVAPLAHGHADRPVNFGAAQRGNELDDRSIAKGDTKALSQDGAAKLGNGASMSYGRMHFIACVLSIHGKSWNTSSIWG